MKEILLHIYPYTIQFTYGLNYKKYKKQIKKLGFKLNHDKEFFNDSIGLCSIYGSNIVIHLAEKPKEIKDLTYINHEVLHAVEYIMSRIGMSFDRHTDEAYCYLLEYITKEIYTYLNFKITY